MARYIDADNLIDKCDCLFKETDTETVNFMRIGYNHAVADTIAIARNLPTADVRENVHAHWEEVDKYGNRKCSNCKSVEHVPTLMGNPIVWDFCPDCGAQMDGRGEDA